MLGVNLFNPSGYHPYSLHRSPWQQAAAEPSRDMTPGERHERVVDPMSRVQDLLGQRLTAVLAPAGEMHSLQRQDSAIDAQSVAGNVLGMVRQRLNQAQAEGADQARLEALREQAKAGIEQGIKEAREVLQGMGMLTEAMDDGIEQVQELLFEGLQAPEDGPAAPEQSPRLESLQQILRQRLETSFTLEIETQDGDRVKLSFQELESRRELTAYQAGAEGETFVLAARETSRTEYAVSVQGRLDEAELGAITELAGGLRQLSENFFAGDAATALEQGLQLGYDTEQIAGFAFALRQSQSSSQTIRYRQIDALESERNPQIPGLSRVADVIDGIQGLMQQARTRLADTQQTTKDLFGGFLSRHTQAAEFARRAHRDEDEGVKKLAESLVDQAVRRDQGAGAAPSVSEAASSEST